MEVLNPRTHWLVSFIYGVAFTLLGAFLVTHSDESFHYLTSQLFHTAYGANSIIRPDGDGSISATQTSCGGAGNYDCLNEVITEPTAPAAGDSLTIPNGGSDYYQMQTISGVDTVSEVVTKVYHIENSNTMAVYVSLWDAAETTQYGTEVQLPVVTAAAQWDTATITASLSQAQLDGMRVRLRCDRPGGGKASDCTVSAMYSEVEYTEVIDVTVSATGSQQDIFANTINNYVGGAFVISEETGSRNVTGITIEEVGTIDEQNDISNVKLFYEQVADCSVASYDGTEDPFGSTLTGGFDGASQATFTDSVLVGTATDMCVYVVLDIGDAAAADTLELQITNPQSDVVASGAPSISPVSTIALADTTTVLKTTLTQTGYHWRLDNGDETNIGADSATGAQNTGIDAATKNTNYRLRLLVENFGNATSSATTYELEYAQKISNCSDVVTWTGVDDAADDWDMSLSSFIADGNTTNITTVGKGAITETNSIFLGTGALRESSANSGAITLNPDAFTELEYSIIGSTSIVDGTTYCLRVSDSGTNLQSYSEYAEITFDADITVMQEEAQVSTIAIPSTNVEIGSFAITDSTAGAHNLTDITITASTTADVVAAYDNIKLFWEYDNDATPDCVSETYAGTENQFGNTDTDGFSTASSSSFTESTVIPSISPTQTVCVYVVLDVTNAANDDEYLDILITNPSLDVTVVGGTVAPSSPVPLTGSTQLIKANVVQTAYHWRDNLGTEATAGSLTSGVENTAYVEMPENTVTRLRFGIANTGNLASSSLQFRLEWGQKLSTCEAISNWEDIATGGDDWEMVASQLIENANTSNVVEADGGVSDTGTFTAVAGQKETTSQTNSVSIGAQSFVELEYSIRAVSSIPEGSSYCFRVTNAGGSIPHLQYPEASIKLGTDFVVYRDVVDLTGATVTITEGVDYDLQLNDASRAYVRITNAHHTGGGPAAGSTGNHNADDVTAYIQNPENIATSITFARAAFPSNDTRIAWEIVEYVGASGGENEFVVRDAGTATYVTTNTSVTTGAVSGIVDDNDVAVFITGQYNPDTQRQDYNTVLSTSAWNAGADTATFTRGEAGGDAVQLSYAVVEFTGSNWKIQRTAHTYSTTGVTETNSITAVNSLSRAFVHAQHQAGTGLDSHANFGHEVWLSSIGAVSFRINGAATTPTSHTSVAWVIENIQTNGRIMKVTRSNSSIPANGGGLTSVNVDMNTTLDDQTIASLFLTTSSNGTGRTFPEPMVSGIIISDTQYNLQVSDDADTILYRAAVVEWPSAAPKLIQNDYRIYEDNDAITPTVPYAGLGENQEMTKADNPLANGESARIRINLTVTAAALPPGVNAYQLEFAKRPATSSCSVLSSWHKLGDSSSTTAIWRGKAASPVDGTTLPSTLLAASNVAATYEEENTTALTPNLAVVNDNIEFDWNVQHNGADDKSDYCFRMVNADNTELEPPNTYPVLRTAGFDPVVSQWRFYSDTENLTPSIALGDSENSTPSGIDNDDVVALRVTLNEQSGAAGVDVKFKLQFSEYADFSTVTDVVASSTCSENSLWCYADIAGDDNDGIVEAVLSDADTCTGGSGNGCGTYNEGTSTVSATVDQAIYSTAEYQFALQNAGARVNAVYYFRLYNENDNEIVLASTTYPSVLAASSSATIATDGLEPGASVDGYVLDATTTPTSVQFGSVPFDTEYEAAQRFSFDVNSTEGYKVYVYTDQHPTNVYGDIIQPVSATNNSPAGWGTACATPDTGCFGYHSGDDVLSEESGSSIRFAADDSFAAFSTTPEEVFYSSVPGASVHDIVYKMQIGDQQPAGEYQSALTYLVVPVF